MQVCYFTSALLQLARVSASHHCRSYRCIVAGTRFQCPFDPPLVCGILDHWIAELQPHANKRDPVLSRHYAANRQVPWQRCLAELLPLHSLPQSLEHFCDLEHVNDSVVFNSVRAVFKDTCEQMLAKLKPVSDSAERQQELADWMMEGFKEFAPRNKIAPVGSCASGLQTSDSDFNMLMQPHDLQARVFSQSLPPPRQPAEKSITFIRLTLGAAFREEGRARLPSQLQQAPQEARETCSLLGYHGLQLPDTICPVLAHYVQDQRCSWPRSRCRLHYHCWRSFARGPEHAAEVIHVRCFLLFVCLRLCGEWSNTSSASATPEYVRWCRWSRRGRSPDLPVLMFGGKIRMLGR
jgi:hypothetical protein